MMRKLYIVLLVFLMLGTVVTFINCSGPSSIENSTDPISDSGACTESDLDHLKSEIINTLSTVTTDADFSFKVVTEDGMEIHYDRGASTMTSLYQSASTSKWPTATIILSYMESDTNQNSAQRLTLNSHPQDFLGSTIWPISSTDPLYQMTLRQLLSFSSGLTNQANCLQPGSGALVNFWDCITNVANDNKNLGLVPGITYDYNSDHLQVAGAMAVKARDIALGVTNSTWQDLYHEFQSKTGLFPSSVYNSPSLQNPRLAGGMTWTGDEYVAFLKANYFNQILSASAMPGESAPYRVQQFQDQVNGLTIGNSPAITNLNEEWHYGFGLWLECHSNPFNCENSVTAWACPGSLGSYPFMDRKNHFYGIIARQGGLATFSEGYAVYKSVSDLVNKWAAKDCSK